MFLEQPGSASKLMGTTVAVSYLLLVRILSMFWMTKSGPVSSTWISLGPAILSILSLVPAILLLPPTLLTIPLEAAGQACLTALSVISQQNNYGHLEGVVGVYSSATLSPTPSLVWYGRGRPATPPLPAAARAAARPMSLTVLYYTVLYYTAPINPPPTFARDTNHGTMVGVRTNPPALNQKNEALNWLIPPLHGFRDALAGLGLGLF